jgi:hypothetical protein
MFLFLVAPAIWTSAREPLPGYTLEGRPFTAAIERVSSRGTILLEGGNGAWDDQAIYRWGALRENLVQPQFILAGGGELVTELTEIQDDTVRVGASSNDFFAATMWLGATLPRHWVRGVLVRPPADSRERDELLERIQDEHATDVAWLDNGDRLRGEFLGPRTSDELLDPNQPWTWRVGNSELEIDRSRLIAMAWKSEASASPAPPPHRMQLGFRDGSRLHIQGLRRDSSVAGAVPRILLALGPDIELALEESVFQQQLCFLQPVQERVRYLSELPPIGFRHVPVFALTWPLGMDRNVLGGRLRAGEWWYEKGLGMHSVSRVAYEVPAGATRFQAELVVDRSSGRQGSVEGRVYVQAGSEPWRLLDESPVVRGGDTPWAVDVALAGAERLALIVDHADLGSQGDRANWLHARFLLPASEP